MPTATFDGPMQLPAVQGILPRRMRVLYVTTAHRTGGRLAEALAADTRVGSHPGGNGRRDRRHGPIARRGFRCRAYQP